MHALLRLRQPLKSCITRGGQLLRDMVPSQQNTAGFISESTPFCDDKVLYADNPTQILGLLDWQPP